MSCETINSLTNRWNLITDKVIRFEEIDIIDLQVLMMSTCEVLKSYSKDELIPKEISNLLLKMKDFIWWVVDLEETPIHCLYQDLLSIISVINFSFLTCGFEEGKAEKLIKELNK